MLKLLGGSAALTMGYLHAGRKVAAEQPTPTAEKAVAKSALCIMVPDHNSGVRGLVSFNQKGFDAPTQIVANIVGLNPNSNHGLHIHEFGDLTEGCASAGDHFNPNKKNHGGPLDAERHVGDLGNIKTDEKGHGYLAMEDKQITLFGELTVIGRSVVVHAQEDDLGRGNNLDSKKTGNSGSRLACGVIALAKEFKNLPPK